MFDPQKTHYTHADFQELVANETDLIERKAGVGQDPLQEAFVAFSNAQGGTILVGVTDEGRVAGRRLDQGVVDRIHDAALAATNVGRYRIFEIQVGSTAITVITIEKRVEGFAQTSDGRVLVRRGARNISLFGADLSRFISERALQRFELTETDLTLERAVPEYLGDLCNAFGWENQSPALPDRLTEKGLLGQHGSLTIAGALFLTDPSNSLRQNKSVVEVRRYPEGGIDYDRREEFGGPANRQVVQATQFIMDELGSDIVVTGLYRHELPRLPEVVVRETIANAVAHRSYEAQGTAVVVELRPDEVIVTSPGGLPEPVTVENMRQAQAARNQDVIDVLRRFRLAEDAGRGIDVIEDSMEEALLDPPVFADLGHAVSASLPLRGPITSRERAWVSDLERRGEITGPDRLLLVHAARGERLTNARARGILNVDSFEARDALHRLRDADLLQQHGSRGGASYSLVEDVAPPAAFRMTPTQVADLVLNAAREGPISNEDVRALTGLDRRRALELLKKLVDSGRLQRSGSRRGTRYVANG
ncbi:MAG: ATP-binding protein [Actinomycetota bacterium]